jgi:hypothetical protein
MTFELKFKDFFEAANFGLKFKKQKRNKKSSDTTVMSIPDGHKTVSTTCLTAE